ncbi:MAG: M16 family metallopeptidase [Cyclobacteriaceae bacterium]
MIDYQNFTLDNGLRVFVHQDITLPTATVNLLYNVGSRDEDENKTGFAHLFEHLMFGGSKHIPSYDEPLQLVGGENNAFTSPDITNYYISLPAENLETAFWLESDRMLSLSFDPKVLDVQRKVVIEEYKQQYLNQPYGDALIRQKALAYKVHPYRWPTIGRDISHIADARMEDVQAFFYKFYRPNNAILVVAGNVVYDDVRRLSEKWFGPIPAGEKYLRRLPAEPVQKEKREEHVEADVPVDAIYKSFHIPGRLDERYYAADLLSDILGRGKSARLYSELVKKRKLFSSISAYVSGSVDPGLLTIQGKLSKGVKPEEGEAGINEVTEAIRAGDFSEEELQKVKNQSESSIVFSELELLNRAVNLAYGALLGNPDLINQESELVQKVNKEDIKKLAQTVLTEENNSTLFYHAKDKAED